MEFARRGPATDGVDDGRRRLPDHPPQHVQLHNAGAGDPMLVMREALLSQLQKDRLRQEIIVAELAKIERAMALRAASGYQAKPMMPRHAGDVELAKPWLFSADQCMPQSGGAVSWEHYDGVGEEHDVKLLNNNGRQRSADSEPGNPVMEHGTYECLEPCECKAGQQNAAFDEQKLSDSSETVPPNLELKWELTGITIPVKKPKPPMKWNCAICQVQATTEQDLQKHCAGKKHQSNIAILESRIKAIGGQKMKTAAGPSPGTDQIRTCSVRWSCRTCQANGTCESDLQEHLKGRRHQQNITTSCKKGINSDMAKNIAPQKAKSHKSNVPQHAEKPPSVWSCSICKVICNCESDLEIHLKGKRHLAKIRAILEQCKNMAMNCESQEAKLNPNSVPRHAEKTNCELDLESQVGERNQLNIEALCGKINQEKNNPPQIAKDQTTASQWDCAMCQTKCNSKSQFEHHCLSRKHQYKIKVILGEGKNARASSLETANELPSDGSNSKNESSEKVEGQKALNFCEVCNLQCNSDKMLVHHRTGKKHQAKLNAMK